MFGKKGRKGPSERKVNHIIKRSSVMYFEGMADLVQILLDQLKIMGTWIAYQDPVMDERDCKKFLETLAKGKDSVANETGQILEKLGGPMYNKEHTTTKKVLEAGQSIKAICDDLIEACEKENGFVKKFGEGHSKGSTRKKAFEAVEKVAAMVKDELINGFDKGADKYVREEALNILYHQGGLNSLKDAFDHARMSLE